MSVSYSPQDIEAIFSNRRKFICRLRFQDAHANLRYFSVPYAEQLALIDAYEDPAVETIVVLKPRQIGISTMNCAHSWWETFTARNALRTLIATNHTDTTESMFSKFKTYHKWMPESFKRANPFRFNQHKKSIVSDRTDALVNTVTARGDAAGEGWTYQRFIGEEVALWPHAEEVWGGIQPTLHKGAKKIFISTPRGPGNFYHDRVLNAQRAQRLGDPSVKLLFSRWADHPTYRLPVPAWWTPSDEEMELAQVHGLNLEQLYWRHQKINGVEGIGLRRFRMEYPLTVEDGFMMTDGAWFDLSVLSERLSKMPAEEKGELKIYREPEYGMEYVIGVDPSWCTGGDFAVACVINQWGEQCAVLTHHLGGHDRFAMDVADLANKYNNALTLVEGNKGGSGSIIIEHLRREGIKLWRDRNGKFWVTNNGNKEKGYAYCRQLVNNDYLEINDHQTIQEMMHISEEKGKIEGRDGHHDDHPMAFMLAVWALRRLSAWTGRPSERVRRTRSMTPIDIVMRNARMR